jgi:actin related protein 2/3 complex subunit 1A/1B
LDAEVAICPNNNEVHIYQKGSSGWSLAQKLGEVRRRLFPGSFTSISWNTISATRWE